MRSDTPISEVMRREFVSLGKDELLDLAEDVMNLGRIRHLPVLDGEQLVGMVSQRDLLAASLSRVLDFEPADRRNFLRSVKVSEVMTTDVIHVEPEATAREVARLMVRHKIGCVPVLGEKGRVLGIVTEADLLASLFEADD